MTWKTSSPVPFKKVNYLLLTKTSLHILKLDSPSHRDTTFQSMSSHALMGRPAVRLETMALVIRLYVLVYIVGKSQ